MKRKICSPISPMASPITLHLPMHIYILCKHGRYPNPFFQHLLFPSSIYHCIPWWSFSSIQPPSSYSLLTHTLTHLYTDCLLCSWATSTIICLTTVLFAPLLLRHKLPFSCPQTSTLFAQGFFWIIMKLILHVYFYFSHLGLLCYSTTPGMESNFLSFAFFKECWHP